MENVAILARVPSALRRGTALRAMIKYRRYAPNHNSQSYIINSPFLNKKSRTVWFGISLFR